MWWSVLLLNNGTAFAFNVWSRELRECQVGPSPGDDDRTLWVLLECSRPVATPSGSYVFLQDLASKATQVAVDVRPPARLEHKFALTFKSMSSRQSWPMGLHWSRWGENDQAWLLDNQLFVSFNDCLATRRSRAMRNNLLHIAQVKTNFVFVGRRESWRWDTTTLTWYQILNPSLFSSDLICCQTDAALLACFPSEPTAKTCRMVRLDTATWVWSSLDVQFKTFVKHDDRVNDDRANDVRFVWTCGDRVLAQTSSHLWELEGDCWVPRAKTPGTVKFAFVVMTSPI